MTEWINPDLETPPATTDVIIALGTQQDKVESYKLARAGGNGAFYVSNGAYGDSCLYSENSPHRTNNAYRVIGWAEFDECDI